MNAKQRIKQRIKQLEKQSGAGAVTEYLCFYDTTNGGEYSASPTNGAQGKTYTFKKQEAMTAFFDKRKDFALLTVLFVDEEPNTGGEHGNE